MLISKKNAQCFLYTGIAIIAGGIDVFREILSNIFLYTEGNGCTLNGKDISCEKAILNQSIILILAFYILAVCVALYIRCKKS